MYKIKVVMNIVFHWQGIGNARKNSSVVLILAPSELMTEFILI